MILNQQSVEKFEKKMLSTQRISNLEDILLVKAFENSLSIKSPHKNEKSANEPS